MEITITTHDSEPVDVVTETAESERHHADSQPPEESPAETVVSPPERYQPQQLTIAVESNLPTEEGTDVAGPPPAFGPPGSW
ncbi:hypothetical protein [Natrinema hispanicum]|uniref:Uncharacterized protein n=1 Tax=Natrinema hispanicum TaxID=392421 RepID=A0A1G6L2V6_9EURY|nr:hypothetical protein [Natrinema hispanicum]SDC37514.1 hypothetical protein SAMN05192552_1003169 [Natrinema hispanicum]SET03069.1 hypothetical protein SAMN04488694_103139 [Natrinema hispanicum]